LRGARRHPDPATPVRRLMASRTAFVARPYRSPIAAGSWSTSAGRSRGPSILRWGGARFGKPQLQPPSRRNPNQKEAFMITFLALAASAALTNAAPSIDGNRETVQMAVEYGDLNLATASGQRRLNYRIEAAAQAICGSAEHLDLRALTANEECRAGVRASAKPQVEIAIAKARQSTAVAAASSLVGGQ